MSVVRMMARAHTVGDAHDDESNQDINRLPKSVQHSQDDTQVVRVHFRFPAS
jgi:hypothetical protein